jgi:apolipoprotein N-acyltransferase
LRTAIIAARTTAVPSRRTFASTTVTTTVVACLCAFALHLAFPLSGWWWIAPFALAGLFGSWSTLAPGWAALAGYLSGIVFFASGFSWFAETVGGIVGPLYAPLIVLGPAAIEGVAFALVAALVSLAARRCDARAVPFAAAAAYALVELLRSTGTFGVPFSQLGVAMIDSPLRPLAAFGGGYLLTFAAALLGASLGWWLLDRTDGRRARVALGAWAAVAVCTGLAWAAWPARHAAPPTRRVAAVQGGIAQTVKRSDSGLALAIARYTALTVSLRGAHPDLVLWPETVITDDLSRDPVLRTRFAALARELHSTLYAGAFTDDGTREQNALFIYDPKVNPFDSVSVYVKEQLVPFVEYVPGPNWLRALPAAKLTGGLAPGHNAVETRNGVTPLICWESVFSDIAHDRLRDDPSLLLIATDDAWFGTTQGPYEHAQAATLRAVETGRWVLRAGATGVSGIVAPDGRWTRRTTVSGVPTTVVGEVGPPAPGPYARLGPAPVAGALALILLLPFAPRRRTR